MSASSSQLATVDKCIISIADDHLSATLRLSPDAIASEITEAHIIAAMKAAELPITDAEKRNVKLAIVALSQRGPKNEGDPAPFEHVLVKGRAAVEGEDEKLQWDDAYAKLHTDWQGDANINYYSVHSIATVKENALIGELKPIVPACDGRDVFGQPILTSTQPHALDIGENIRIETGADGRKLVYAATAGKVVETPTTLSVDPLVRIAGDIDFESGSVDATTHVSISGDVKDRFEVVSAKSITIGGVVEQANISAAEDVVVRGGLLGHGGGLVRANGNIVAKFASESHLQADADIKICKGLMNVWTHAGGSLMAEGGAVIGGWHFARHGGAIRTLGSDANTKTLIYLGVDPAWLAEADQLETELAPKRLAIEKIRNAVGPLMANLKRLSPEQREKATELMFQADEAEMEINDAIERRESLLGLLKCLKEVRLVVHDRIWPGVQFGIGRRLVKIESMLHGPLAIQLRSIKNVTEVAMVNQLTGSVTRLKACEGTPEQLIAGRPESFALESDVFDRIVARDAEQAKS